MEEQHLCFKCAFWKWQKRLDVEVRPNEGIIPIITQKYYKTVVQVNTQTHYCLTLGDNHPGVFRVKVPQWIVDKKFNIKDNYGE